MMVEIHIGDEHPLGPSLDRLDKTVDGDVCGDGRERLMRLGEHRFACGAERNVAGYLRQPDRRVSGADCGAHLVRDVGKQSMGTVSGDER